MKIFFLSLLISFSTAISAGEIKSTIEYIQINTESSTSNIAVIKLNSEAINSPNCATESRFSLNLANESGNATLSILLAAQASGKTVHIWGTGTCNTVPYLESISYLRIF